MAELTGAGICQGCKPVLNNNAEAALLVAVIKELTPRGISARNERCAIAYSYAQ